MKQQTEVEFQSEDFSSSESGKIHNTGFKHYANNGPKDGITHGTKTDEAKLPG